MDFFFAGFAVQHSIFHCARRFAIISLMRVCFNGLCFASRRTAAVDEETQTVTDFHRSINPDGVIIQDTGGGGTSVQTNLSNIYVETAENSHNCNKTTSNTRSKLLSLLTLNNLDKKLTLLRCHKMDINDTQNHQQQLHNQNNHTNLNSNQFDVNLLNRNHNINNNNNNKNDLTKMDTTPSTTNPSTMSSHHLLIVDTNSNEMSATTTTFQYSPTNQLLNERIGDLSVSGNEFENMEHCHSNSNSFSETNLNMNLNSEQHLLQVIQLKSARINDLEQLLRTKDNEIAELKSHLDKFQSVFPFSSRGRKGGVHGANGQRQRAQGISAEPQSESSVLELLQVTFPKYDKDER